MQGKKVRKKKKVVKIGIRNDYISVRAFAKQLNLKSHNSIIEAMDNGILINGVYVHPKNKHRKILPEIALKEWNDYFKKGELPEAEGNGQTEKRGGGKSSNSTYSGLRAQLAKVKLDQEKIKLGQMAGKLVLKDKVYNQLFQMGKEIKDKIMVIPDRVIDEIIASGTRNEAHSILTIALSDALEALANADNIDFE